MANPIGYTLSRIIRQRSYTAGELKIIEERISQAQAALREARIAHKALLKEQKHLTARLAELDAELTQRSEIEPSDIYARRPIPKRYTDRYGSVVATLVELLKESDAPLTTTQIVSVMAEKFTLPQTTASERRYARKWVTAKLRVLVKKGAVVPLHDLTDNLTGLWRWTGI
jgi:hypothetical protein